MSKSKISKFHLPLLVSAAILTCRMDAYASSASAAATTTTDDEQARTAMSTALSADHLSPNNILISENIRATVDGRIRFNQGILRMLNDEKITIEERVSEYHEMQGVTLPVMSQVELEKLLQDAKHETTEEIETLRTTQIVCRVPESGKMPALKSGFFLAINIYSTILRLQLNQSHLSKALKQKSISSQYSEVPYYEKMQRYLSQSNLPKLHEIMGDLFVPFGGNVGFKCKVANLNKASAEIGKLRKQYNKHSDDQQFDAVLDSLYLHCTDFEQLNKSNSAYTVLSTEFLKHTQVNFSRFRSLHEGFNVCFWPYIEIELKLQKLLTDIEETEKKFRRLIKLSKIKSSSKKTPVSSSTTDDKTQATKIAEPEPDLGEEEQQQQKKEAASAVSSLSVAHEETEETEESDTADTSAADALQQTSAASSYSYSYSYSYSSSPAAASSQSSPHVFEWMKALRGEARVVDFSDMLKAFKQSFGDQEDFEIKQSKVTEITFRGPSHQLTKIFCHTPHGSQLTKAWPAWRHNMIDGLEGSGFELHS